MVGNLSEASGHLSGKFNPSGADILVGFYAMSYAHGYSDQALSEPFAKSIFFLPVTKCHEVAAYQ
ncbi:MAG: hypothetical protein NTU98_02645 [Bacteroidetes bacterium]|nr:hypothetical protein [Bacteroidota bacterium]